MPSLSEKVVAYARNHHQQFVGPLGECYDLANRALKASGGLSAPDFCTVTPDADYVWGTPVSLAILEPGDILQFRDYWVQQTTQTSEYRYSQGGPPEISESTPDLDFEYERPHHTAIVLANRGQGNLQVAEQNAPRNNAGKPIRIVVFNVIDLWPMIWAYPSQMVRDGADWVVTYRTVERTVGGTVWGYRPQPVGTGPTAQGDGGAFGPWGMA